MKSTTGKTALVLAGGGLTGAVYEIGALRAIDDLLQDRTVNDFDIYVGTSAGALIASFIASGVGPEEMLQVIDGTHPYAGTIKRQHIFNLNWHQYLEWGMKLPVKLLEAWTHYLRNFGDMTLFDLLWSLSEALPSGLYDPDGLEEFVRSGMRNLGYSNDFRDLPRDLYIIATDLDCGQRAIFGRDYIEAPISTAVAASSAMPIIYTPVRFGDGEYVDGGARGNASIDLAIEKGATLVVCINPLVPFDNQNRDKIPFLGPDGGHLSKKGVQSIANQVFHIFLHSGLHYHIKQVRRAHPEVDIILIEPSSEDYQMFFYNIMRYSARLIIARHGFESVTLNLAQEYQMYKDTLARHGIPISRRLVIEELNDIAGSDFDPNVIRRVLEATTPRCGSRRRNMPVCQLDRTLAELELVIEQFRQPGNEATPQA
jgi:NTE family protein